MNKSNTSLLRPIRLGVYFDQELHAGGGYQEAINGAILVKKVSQDLICPVFITSHKGSIDILKSFGINAVFLPLSRIEKVGMLFRSRVLIKHTRILAYWRKLFLFNGFERKLDKYDIDLIYFLSPTAMANNLEVTRYIIRLWDLSHRDDLEFPEVYDNRKFESRENRYRSILPKAVAVLVDSPLGRMNAARRYGLDSERIHVLPFSPAPVIQDSSDVINQDELNIVNKYRLDVPYIFYPAQFWAHKNHVYLLEGLEILEREFGVKLGAIFSGGDQGNLDRVKSAVKKLNLEDRVRFAGFVSNEEVPLLYRQSVALVMPSYFGPTNLPPLEAFQLGVPVIYSDRPGLRDQVNDAALLMDLNDPSSLARHLNSLIEDSNLRKDMISKGRDQLDKISDSSRVITLEEIFKDFQRRMISWTD